MNIAELMQKMHAAITEVEKEKIANEIEKEFSSLSEEEKSIIQKEFVQLWDNKLKEAEETIKKVDIALEMKEISQYLSFAKISKVYFGKSKEWLYQRINGFIVNGKPAQFNDQDKEKLSQALIDLSDKIHQTAIRISN
jgi:hypothetical protein